LTIDVLNAAIRACKKCRLFESRTNALCGEGNPRARLMLIALSPGVNEDREGRMFIGPSGKVLDELLVEAGIDRKELYMTNLLKCMLPGCRKPKQDEIEACSSFLDREIELIDPKVIAPLGYYAIRYVFGKYAIPLPPKPEFHKIFGKTFIAQNKVIIPLRHPAAVLYNHSLKQELTRHFRQLKTVIAECE
jgi:uracil-DNA glycosylase family 4